jgi:hypothetical protein
VAKTPKETARTAAQLSADYAECGCCGQIIGKTQGYTPVFNTRFGNYEFYHDSYLGCREATDRRNSRPRVVLNRFRNGFSELLYGESNNDSFAENQDEIVTE